MAHNNPRLLTGTYIIIMPVVPEISTSIIRHNPARAPRTAFVQPAIPPHPRAILDAGPSKPSSSGTAQAVRLDGEWTFPQNGWTPEGLSPAATSGVTDANLARHIFTAGPTQTWFTEHYFVAWVIAILLHLLFGTVMTVWILPPLFTEPTLIVTSEWTDYAAEDSHEAVLETFPPAMRKPPITAAEFSPVDLQQEIPQLGAVQFPVLGAAVFDSSLYEKPLTTTPSLTSPVMFRNVSRPVGGGLQGRTAEARGRLTAKHGGTEESEKGVELALAWLAAHQRPDGSWHFNHEHDQCDGKCLNKGTVATTTGATALALLPFLGAGYTHREGDYRHVVGRGLHYLTTRAVPTSRGADLQEGTMYAHGIAAVALCEAYAMTKDEALRPLAQSAIDFIVNAQHPAGGWRYFPGQAGDTTVFGWQMMALRSARLAELDVPPATLDKAAQFLDQVSVVDGSSYGYQSPGCDKSPTAIGLLTRMYLRGERNDPQLQAGIRRLVEWGPSKSDMYFNFYATQTMLHHGGAAWERWNLELREHLLAEQELDGHAAGSWFFSDQHAYAGGRLYTTAVCALILEVYYRHLPLYGETTVGRGY